MVGEKSSATHSDPGRADFTKLSRRPPPAPISRKRVTRAGKNSRSAASPSRRWGMVSARSRYPRACCAEGQRLTFAAGPREDMAGLDAPAVALGVLQGALHFFAQHYREDG